VHWEKVELNQREEGERKRERGLSPLSFSVLRGGRMKRKRMDAS